MLHTVCRASGDSDVMFFDAAAGAATFQALTLSAWGPAQRTDLYLSVVLKTLSGTHITGYKGYGVGPFTANLPSPGRYVVYVYGYYPTTGDWKTAGDFDDYGSIGQYKLKASYKQLVTPSP